VHLDEARGGKQSFEHAQRDVLEPVEREAGGDERVVVRMPPPEKLSSSVSVDESPLANSVTSWPCRTSSSVRYETTRSVPP